MHWVYLVIVLDWYTKKIVGWNTSLRSKTVNWKEAVCFRTSREEVIWLNEFETLEEAIRKIGNWIEIDYNKLYVHSELGYWSLEEFEIIYNQENLKVVA